MTEEAISQALGQGVNDSGKIPVTACVITYNEAEQIEACLASLEICAAIVVVDSHSGDATRSLAESSGARVIERDWPGHIGQKNFAIDQAETDWVLCIDADERVTPELATSLGRLFSEGPKHPGYFVKRRTHYLGRFIDHGGFYPDAKLRLFRRSAGRWAGTNPHDHVALEDGDRAAGALAGDLHHYSYKDIADHLKTIDYFTTIIARQKLARRGGWGLASMLFAPPFKFFKMYILQTGFRDGRAGFVVAALGAFYVFLKYAKLWELEAVVGATPDRVGSVHYGRRGDGA